MRICVLITLAAVAALAGCAGPAQRPADSATIRVAPERVTQCHAQGGCLLVTADEIREGFAEAYAAGAAANTCGRAPL